MTKNEIVGRLRNGGLDASSTNRSAAVYVADAREGMAAPGWFAYRIICDSEATERRARAILSRWYDIEASGNVWRLRSRNRVPLMAIKRGGVPPTPPTPPTVEYMYFEAVEPNSTVSMTSSLVTAPNLEYSEDGVTWQEWQHTTADDAHTFDTLTLGSVGDRVYLKGLNPNGYSDIQNGIISCFSMTGKIAAGGNAQTLVDGDNPTLVAKKMPMFSSLLITQQPNTALISAPSLPATTLTDLCYYGMFAGCAELIAAPSIPATTLPYGCCSTMFGFCTSLITAVNMESITTIGEIACMNMYSGCTSLTAAENMPALTTIGVNGCLDMYSGCTSLTAAANMPALTTIGVNGCETMYDSCTFNMSNDGTTLNFAFPTPPITAGETTYATAYDVAEWMGNTTGFTTP